MWHLSRPYLLRIFTAILVTISTYFSFRLLIPVVPVIGLVLWAGFSIYIISVKLTFLIARRKKFIHFMRHFSFPQKSEGRKTAKKNKKNNKHGYKKRIKNSKKELQYLVLALLLFLDGKQQHFIDIQIDVVNNNNTANSIQTIWWRLAIMPWYLKLDVWLVNNNIFYFTIEISGWDL